MAHLLHLAREGERLRPEEVEPQVPMGLDPQVPFSNDGEDGLLAMEFGLKFDDTPNPRSWNEVKLTT